ncbi:putative quinol monooxygenase [Halopseudomonas sabulinigri]
MVINVHPEIIMQDKTKSSMAAKAATTASPAASHAGVQVLGEQGSEGRKAFYIHIEALPGKEQQVMQMLRDIRDCVEHEPATGPWFAVRLAPTTFAIFEAFPDLAGRQAHVEGGGGDIFRDLTRMNAILAFPAQVHRADVLMSKDSFAHLPQ